MPNDAELAPHRPDLHQRLLQHGDVLAEPRDAAHRALPGRARRRRSRSPRPTCGPTRATRPPSPATLVGILRRRERPARAGARAVRRAALLRLGPKSGRRARAAAGNAEPRPRCCASAGYEVGLQGQVAPDPPVGGDGPLLGGWGPRDAERLERDYGFADWEPPDAGENAKAEHFGGGQRRPLGEGWDEVYTRQAERWLGRADLPEPFCLVVSLVNPHDVLGYPGSVRARRLRRDGVPRPRRGAAADRRRGPARQARPSTR